MREFVKLRHASLVRSDDVCTEHSDVFDVNPGTKNTRLALHGYVAESTRLLALQKQAFAERKAATQQCQICRGVLRASCIAVVRVGKLVTLPDTVMATLVIPSPMRDRDLLDYAQALHDRVLPYLQAFEDKALPPDGLQKLTDGIQALTVARAAYAATIQDSATADQAVQENHDKAALTISALESLIPAPRRDVLTKLRIARRVGPRRVQPPATAAAGNGTTGAPSTVPPSTPPASPTGPSTPASTDKVA
jgi:hypothetical protein